MKIISIFFIYILLCTFTNIYSQGIEWVDVPAGSFTYGPVSTSQTIEYDYKIMKYEVTNAMFMKFLTEAFAAGKIKIDGKKVKGFYAGDDNDAAGEHDLYLLDTGDKSAARIMYNGKKFVLTPDTNYNNHPVVYVTYYGAWAFADFYGYSLPTEQEWEKAARGNTGYAFPWGNEVNGSRANYSGSGDSFDSGTTPVGYYNGQKYGNFQTTDSPGPYGCYDMAGNACEWTDSWYDAARRVIRGGSWNNKYGYDLCIWYRSVYVPAYTNKVMGFRCVKK